MSEQLVPRQDNSIYIKHKSINGQPFLELTVFSRRDGVNEVAIDSTTFSPTENQTLSKVILEWMYKGA